MRSRSLLASFALFAVALILPLATLLFLATRWYVDSESARLGATVHLIGDHLRERVDRELAEMSAIARTLATSPAIDAGDHGRFETQSRAIVDPETVTVTLSDLNGRQFVNTRSEPGRPLPTVDRPDLVKAVVDARRAVVSGVLVSALTGRQIIGVTAPVIRDGAVTHLVSVVVRLDHFRRLIEDQKIVSPYSARILDGIGLDVAATGPLVGEGAEAEPVHDRTDDVEVVDRSVLADWTIVTGVERAAMAAPLRRSLLILGGIGTLLLGLGGFVAARSARRASAAVRELADAAEGIGQGRRVTFRHSSVREADVVGLALADASARLAHQNDLIAASHAQLAARVEARGRELETSRAHARVLAENITDVVILRRRGSRSFAYVSPSSLTLLGYAPDETCGARLIDAIHSDDLPNVHGIDAALEDAPGGLTCLFRLRRKDGAWLWIESVSSFVASAGPDEPDVLSVLRDVTVRQEQAEELRLARDMAELAKAKAEHANTAKSEFLAVLSHEIRTPLASIKGLTELLSDTRPLSAEQGRYIALVTEATSTMLTAVDDILDYAQVEAGNLRLDAKPFALMRAIESVVGFVRPVAAGKGITLGVTLGPDLPSHVLGDERRLRQVLLNLLNTVLRSRRGGMVTLFVHGLRGREGKGRLSLALTASGTHAVARDGAGLGLTIAQRLVELMGGRIETMANASETTSYRFTLSLPPAEERAVPEAAAPGATAAGIARLLVVEDVAINQEIARAMLERAGYRVDVVDDGAAAIEAVQQVTYDLVLMDVQMPGLDGLAATRRIRSLQHPSRQLPIIAMTANVMPDQMRAIHAAGMTGCVTKPFDRGTLCAAVAAQLSSVVLRKADPAEENARPVPIFDPSAYEALRQSLGGEAARGTIEGFLALLEAGGEDGRVDCAEASTIATVAVQLGFHALGAAHRRLGEADESEAADALRHCRVAQELARRVLRELVNEDGVEGSPRIALL